MNRCANCHFGEHQGGKDVGMRCEFHQMILFMEEIRRTSWYWRIQYLMYLIFHRLSCKITDENRWLAEFLPWTVWCVFKIFPKKPLTHNIFALRWQPVAIDVERNAWLRVLHSMALVGSVPMDENMEWWIGFKVDKAKNPKMVRHWQVTKCYSFCGAVVFWLVVTRIHIARRRNLVDVIKIRVWEVIREPIFRPNFPLANQWFPIIQFWSQLSPSLVFR